MSITTTHAKVITRQLGREQREMLICLVEHKRWYPGAGWIWSTQSKTKRLVESLLKRGLVETTTMRLGLVHNRESTVYVPSADGVALVEGWQEERKRAHAAMLAEREKHHPQALPTLSKPDAYICALCQVRYVTEGSHACLVKTWAVTHDDGGLVVSLNGVPFRLGTSGPAFVADLRRLELFLATPDEVR